MSNPKPKKKRAAHYTPPAHFSVSQAEAQKASSAPSTTWWRDMSMPLLTPPNSISL